MADPSGRLSWARRGRVPSRGSSNRSSGVFDENHLHPGAYTSSHTLRPAESRFSLNEQFAATRRDYEFDDDASSIAPSIWERGTTAEHEEGDDTLVLDGLQPISETAAVSAKRGVVLTRTYYELLCIPEDAALSSDDIFRAYHRLLTILQPERQPPALAPVAQSLLNSVQEAFRTLIEPYRRVAYDLANHKSFEELDSLRLVPYDSVETYEEGLREAYLNLAAGEVVSTTDLGLRLDASPASRRSQGIAQRQLKVPSPVDLQLHQSMTLALPTLGKEVQKLVTTAEDFVQSKLVRDKVPSRRVTCTPPTLTVTGGVHGFLDEPYRLASVVTDRYQPPGPTIHAQRHLEQLISSRFLPAVSIKLRQELSTQSTSSHQARTHPSTVLETELALLPEKYLTARVAHAIDLPNSDQPLNVELCATQYSPTTKSPPALGLVLHRRISTGGTAFLTLDAGDWTLRPEEECLHFSEFSTLTKRFANTRNPFRSAPTVEVGYTVSAYDTGLRSGRGYTQPADRGVRAMDANLDDDPSGSWSVSLGATRETLAGYVRYGRDILSSLSAAQSAVLPPGNRAHRGGGFRAEIELGSSRSWLSGRREAGYLALRALKRYGRFSKFGFEVGVSPSSLHLSLYWSRLGQRISIPFLLATRSSLSSELVFWATILPFLGFGVAEIYARSRAGRRLREAREEKNRMKTQEYISRRRAEADEMTVVLANGVEPRQRIERQNGGLVVLSAKYSVKGAPSDEVADVTVAVAALVDRGELVIPRGLRKGNILGFWDAAPGEDKVLSVRYLCKGREYSVEVAGDEELRLPRPGEKGT
ncbi:hypothetical protein GE09DRAFT_186091 [Coniochaeta sp. 2T2.1]|nr:hypothetical protein GE09DRAFT_186091 [Coniochaeta sp. 2T2.1]